MPGAGLDLSLSPGWFTIVFNSALPSFGGLIVRSMFEWASTIRRTVVEGARCSVSSSAAEVGSVGQLSAQAGALAYIASVIKSGFNDLFMKNPFWVKRKSRPTYFDI